VLSAVLLNPLPVRDPERLAMVGPVHNTGARSIQGGVTYPYYPHVAARGVFESTAAVWLSPLPLSIGSQKAPEATPVMFVSAAFFDVLGLTIPVGRAFSADEDRRGASLVAILSDRHWRAAFGANPDVIGQSLTVGGTPATIIGVAPRGFRARRWT
jgi:putative ABC transport system permease protein